MLATSVESDTSEELLADVRVMIIDDHRAMRSIVRALLAKSGITSVSEAEDGDTALELLETYNVKLPSLIICDLHMERMDGMEFCNLLRRHKKKEIAHIPVLVLTGDSDRLVHEVAEQVGAVKVLTKPISAPDLADEIAKTIGFSA